MAGLVEIKKWIKTEKLRLLLVFIAALLLVSVPIPQVSEGELATASASGETVSRRWDLTRVKASEAWEITPAGTDVLVAVLDTGIARSHPDLSGKVISSVNFTSSQTTEDVYNHGTHIAGIVGARRNEILNTAGLAFGASLLNVKIVEDDGTLRAEKVAQGIIWAADNGARVINLSLVLYKPSFDVEQAVNYAWGKGCVIVAAAGNGNKGEPVYPAAYPNVLAVAATDTKDRLTTWSNRGEWVSLTAPGVSIYSTTINNGYAYMNGTSQSTALVSAEAAILFTITTDANGNGRVNDEISQILKDSCDRLENEAGAGAGRMNVLAAIRKSN